MHKQIEALRRRIDEIGSAAKGRRSFTAASRKEAGTLAEQKEEQRANLATTRHTSYAAADLGDRENEPPRRLGEARCRMRGMTDSWERGCTLRDDGPGVCTVAGPAGLPLEDWTCLAV